MFRGRHEHAIDGKGRTSLPSRFRETLAGAGDVRLMLTTGLDVCVMAYPMREWTAFEEKLMSKSQFDKELDELRHLYFGSAEEVEVDSVGRLLIPQSLRKHAELGREAVWIGMGNHLQLWDRERYDAKYAAIRKDENRVDTIRRRLADLGL